jgi:hypothetical protein
MVSYFKIQRKKLPHSVAELPYFLQLYLILYY